MINPADMLSYAMIWFLMAILGAAMLGRFNKAGTGFLLGLFFGPIGVLIAWGIRDHERSKQDLGVGEAMRKDTLEQALKEVTVRKAKLAQALMEAVGKDEQK